MRGVGRREEECEGEGEALDALCMVWLQGTWAELSSQDVATVRKSKRQGKGKREKGGGGGAGRGEARQGKGKQKREGKKREKKKRKTRKAC